MAESNACAVGASRLCTCHRHRAADPCPRLSGISPVSVAERFADAWIPPDDCPLYLVELKGTEFKVDGNEDVFIVEGVVFAV